MRGLIAGALGIAVIVAATTQPVAVVHAQDPQRPPPVFRGGIDIVQVDVSVLDKKRKPVHGLKAADFTVFENGKPQSVVAVSEVTVADEIEDPPVWARAARPDVASNDVSGKRIFAIVIGVELWRQSPRAPGVFLRAPQFSSRAEDLAAVLDVVQRLVARVVPGDVVCLIAGTSTLRGQSCTSDLSKIADAVDALKPNLVETPPPANLDNLPNRLGSPLFLLRNLTDTLTAAPQRRKAIFFISPGGIVPDRGPDVINLSEALWNAQRGHVTIYTINPFPPRPGELARRARGYDRRDLLRVLSENTGGVSIVEPELVEPGLDQMFVENSSYYLVGYRTSNPAMDGKSRRLEVKVNQRDVTVGARKLLYRPKPTRPDGTSNAESLSGDLDRSLRGFLPNLDVTFDVSAIPFAQGPRAIVPLVIGLREPVAPGATRIRQRMDLDANVYDARGSIVGTVRTNARLDSEPGADNVIRYDVLSQLDLAPGHYSVRLVAHNADTDKLGVINFDLTVPDFLGEAISISGVAIGVEANPPVLSFGQPSSLLPFVPTAVRLFAPSDRVTAFARIYEGGRGALEPATLEVSILDSEGTATFSERIALSADRFDATKSAEWRFELPLRNLKSGHYLLTLKASRGSRHAPQRDVPFAVR